MSTLESKIQQRLRAYDTRVAEGDASAEDEKMEYLLDVAHLFLKKPDEDDEGSEDATALQQFVTVVKGEEKEKLLRTYLADIEKNPAIVEEVLRERSRATSVDEFGVCDICGESTVCYEASESQLVCTNCGTCFPWTELGTANLSFVEEIDRHVVQQISYKKATHFNDLLSSLQARTTIDIDATVLDAMRAELRKDRVTDRSKIIPSRIKGYLKKNNLSKYYRHSSTIANIVSGLPPLQLDPEVETELKRDFAKVEDAFLQISATSNDRTNLPSYQYVLKRLAERRGLTELANRCTLLKSRSKLFIVDAFWKKVCEINGWEFTQTI